MALDDYVTGENAAVAGVTAAVVSPQVRGAIRKGAVFAVAGALKAGDVVAGAVRGAARGARGDEEHAASGDGAATTASATPAPAPARRSRSQSTTEETG